MATDSAVPRLTYLRIKNYRALRDVEFRDLTPLTVLIGPNGSGKSTVLDALDFLAEAVRGNLVQAWEKRDRFRGMRTRGQGGKIEFEARFQVMSEVYQYIFNIKELDGQVFIDDEDFVLLGSESKIFSLYKADALPYGHNYAFRMNFYEHGDEYTVSNTDSSTALLTRILQLSSTLKQGFQAAYLVANIITSYRLLHLTDDHLKGFSDQGPREKLSPSGDNLPNVLYYLHEKHPEVLARISEKLREWVPGLAEVVTEITSDERLLLRFKDAPFEKPLPAQYMSGGTMRLAALLALLYEPGASGLLGIEEPENELHPQLLPRLAEELVQATESRQLLVATHSPFLLDALEPEQVWILHRGADGYTQATRAADIPHVKELVEDGSPLGYLWSSNSLALANPLNPRPAAPDAR